MSKLRFLRGARWALILSIPFGLMLLMAVNAIGLFACRHQWMRALCVDCEHYPAVKIGGPDRYGRQRWWHRRGGNYDPCRASSLHNA